MEGGGAYLVPGDNLAYGGCCIVTNGSHGGSVAHIVESTPGATEYLLSPLKMPEVSSVAKR